MEMKNVLTHEGASGLQSYVNYYPAVLKFCPNPSLGWYIEYYARSSKTQKLSRYRLRLNVVKRRYRKMSEFYVYANTMQLDLFEDPHKQRLRKAQSAVDAINRKFDRELVHSGSFTDSSDHNPGITK